jgi:diguanylate cyclase (GGDEF)-like protein
MRALIVDDDRVTAAIVVRALHRWGIETTVAHDGMEAWARLSAGPPPQLVIADWMMPGIDGIELCQRIRRVPALASIYVLLLTGRSARGDLVAGLDAGADDYMTKPIDPEELRARVQVGVRVATLQRRLAEQVAELEATRDHLARLASTDALTDVYSRRAWLEIAAAEFSRSRRHDRPLGLLLLDLDFFKRVNDTFGHSVGDRLLQTFAAMLRVECRISDAIGRIGGEEFAILLPETSIDAAQCMAERLSAACRAIAVKTAAGTVSCTCSIGVSEMIGADMTIEDMMRRGDAALYAAKASGRDCWRLDSASMCAA